LEPIGDKGKSDRAKIACFPLPSQGRPYRGSLEPDRDDRQSSVRFRRGFSVVEATRREYTFLPGRVDISSGVLALPRF